MLAAAGTYIPVTGATSSAAELVDPAGSYSLAGASAPTLAQPGYYVPTAGASSETPDDPGYYTPYAGATAEILALPPVISGTVAGQSTPSGQSDTPFSSVTITDPNIDTSDSLSIQLTGVGGALADGAGFNGLTTSAPGVYILSGTAAAITSELDALIFTPSRGLRDDDIHFDRHDQRRHERERRKHDRDSSIPVGRSSSRCRRSWPISRRSTRPRAASTSLDTAANITANLDQLNDPNIDVITISGQRPGRRFGSAIDDRCDRDRQAAESERLARAARDQRYGCGC